MRIKGSALRIYVQHDNRFAKLFRLDEVVSRGGEFLVNLVVHGMESMTPVVAGRWESRRFSTEKLTAGFETAYRDMIPLEVAANHFSLHADGTVHLRTKDGVKPPYLWRMVKQSPTGQLDSQSPRALDFMIETDRARKYAMCDPIPKEPALALRAEPGEVVLVRVWASGKDYDLESEVRREIQRYPVERVFVRSWATVKIALVQWRQMPIPSVFSARPRGTLVSFRSDSPGGLHQIDTFVLR